MAKKLEQKPPLEKTQSVVKPPIFRANVNRRHETSPNYFSVYANDVQTQTTPWDIRLILGLITNVPTETTDDSTVTVTQLGELRMSPQLAKLLVMIITQQLREYEERFGEIPLPPSA